MHKKRFLKPTKKKFIHQQQARTLRLKHLKQQNHFHTPKLSEPKRWAALGGASSAM